MKTVDILAEMQKLQQRRTEIKREIADLSQQIRTVLGAGANEENTKTEFE